MIKGLQGTTGVDVQAGNNSVPYVNPNPNNPFQGLIRINGTDIQYFDNNSWLHLPTSYASVCLNTHTQELLQWCEAQRTMSFRRMELAQKHPALEKALEAIKRAEDNFETLERIITSENRTG